MVELPSSEELTRLRAQARQDPDAALTAATALTERLAAATQGDKNPALAALAQIRSLAETNRFNTKLKTVAAESDLRKAVPAVLELASRPRPENKRRLAKPVWGLIGKLEANTTTEPGFAKAAARRLMDNEVLTGLLGQQMTQRLEVVRREAGRHQMTRKIVGMLKTRALDKVVDELIQWQSAGTRTTPAQLAVAVEHTISAMEERSDPSDEDVVRRAATALLAAANLLGSVGLRTRVEAVAERSGASRLKQWIAQIKQARTRPGEIAKLACAANEFVVTDTERKALAAGSTLGRTSIERGGRAAVKAYLKTIAKRDFTAWQAFERPFMAADNMDASKFRLKRTDWVERHRDLDPREGAFPITNVTIDYCKPAVHVELARAPDPKRHASLSVCWQAERRRWFPCRALTRRAAKAMIQP